MIGSLASVDEFPERNQGTDSSSTSSTNSKVQKPPLTHNYSIQSQYCFEEARQREANNAQKLLNLPVNNKQFLVAKGILTKICRKRPKQRTFYLFNDSLVYANISYGKLLAHPHAFKLEEVTITDVSDSGIYRHGFTIETPKKSFTVYASLAEEKRRWVESIDQYAEAARQAAGKDAQTKLSLVTKSPVWIPNSEATHCMVCSVTEFTLVQRRHHCRNCGKVVCGKCSQYRWVLPAQGPNKLRICKDCHELLRSQQEKSKKATEAGKNDSASINDKLELPSQRLPVFAPPNWQQQIEEKLNDGGGDDSDSDVGSDFDGHLPSTHFSACP
ncbi:unnamed protein product [Hymenolepis diminuta]|uniref:FYVE-type domain-containing protein n=1 Tax=Hymenolepis diminuta TaxID=6216 RepID=A0A564Y4K3_HYMDI|nr:unnamed protein product [Hymenolepis diminuta]